MRQTCAALRRAGVRLGVSTHDEAELERALGARARLRGARVPFIRRAQGDAVGTAGPRAPRRWKRRIGTLPLVAIGGLTLERLPGVFAAGADVAAVVTDIVSATEPQIRVRQWLAVAAAA